MNLGDVKTKVLKLIDEYSQKGVPINVTKNADYIVRVADLSDLAQKEIAQYRKINASFVVTQFKINNMLGNQFRTYQHITDDVIFTAQSAKSYYFEVDNIAEIYIEEETTPGVWLILKKIDNTVQKIFSVYKGLITPVNVNDSIRIRFSGAYVYSFKNIALYGVNFPSASDIIAYNPMVKYDLPSDFMELNKITIESDYEQYIDIQNFKWEGKSKVIIPYNVEGSINFLYYKVPITIPSNAPDDTTFEIDEDAQQLIPVYVAQAVMKVENPILSNVLLSEYQNKLANLKPNTQAGQSEMQNAWDW